MEFAIFLAQSDKQIATKFEFHYLAFRINSGQSKFAEYFLEKKPSFRKFRRKYIVTAEYFHTNAYRTAKRRTQLMTKIQYFSKQFVKPKFMICSKIKFRYNSCHFHPYHYFRGLKNKQHSQQRNTFQSFSLTENCAALLLCKLPVTA
jgi:hypothetical protein